MASDTAKENEGPATKRKRLSLSLKRKERFSVLPINGIEDTKKPIVPLNTEKSTWWVVGCLKCWLKQRNKISEEKCPESILFTDDHPELCHKLCVCVIELWKVNGEEYTPRSLAQFIAGLQRYISEKETSFRLTDPEHSVFKSLHHVSENLYRQLHA